MSRYENKSKNIHQLFHQVPLESQAFLADLIEKGLCVECLGHAYNLSSMPSVHVRSLILIHLLMTTLAVSPLKILSLNSSANYRRLINVRSFRYHY